jgi:hypothetical protein
VLLSLLKVVMNLWLEGLDLFNQFWLHEMTVCRRNPCTFLQSCRPASVGQKVLGLRLQWLQCSSVHLLNRL